MLADKSLRIPMGVVEDATVTIGMSNTWKSQISTTLPSEARYIHRKGNNNVRVPVSTARDISINTTLRSSLQGLLFD